MKHTPEEIKNRLSNIGEAIGNIALNYIADLEKENAELKETLKTYNGCGDWDNDFHTCRVYLQHNELQECMEQLTKAKEIIREFVEWANWQGSKCPNFKSIQNNAEQFLSEVEKCG